MQLDDIRGAALGVQAVHVLGDQGIHPAALLQPRQPLVRRVGVDVAELVPACACFLLMPLALLTAIQAVQMWSTGSICSFGGSHMLHKACVLIQRRANLRSCGPSIASGLLLMP